VYTGCSGTNKMKNFILFVFILFAIPVLVTGQSDWTRYKLKNPDSYILNYIEQHDGIVDHFTPGKYAFVYLKPDLYTSLTKNGLRLKKSRDLLWLPQDSLSWRESQLTGKTNDYHTYQEVIDFLVSLESQFPGLCKLYSIGKTVENREMWILKISDNVHTEEAEPEFKYVSTMHGNEIVGQELMLKLSEYLLTGYYSNQRLQDLVDNTEIWIMPNMNFDGTNNDYHGTFNPTRFNANGVDLNRNFPDREYGIPPFPGHPYSIQPETANMIQFSNDHNFVMSANFHGGALVVNYPWDKKLPGDPGIPPYSAAPDDSTFIEFSLSYSRLNLPMYNSLSFAFGITNGAAWYETDGCMQDWNYNDHSCLAVTLEISDSKWPPFTNIDQYWNDNRESMLAFLEKTQTGIHGIVKDSLRGIPLSANIKLLETGAVVFSDDDFGDFYKPVIPGSYSLEISADGYFSKTLYNVQVDSSPAVFLNIELYPLNTYLLGGLVTDTETGLAIPEAEVNFLSISGQKYSVVSSLNGKFNQILPADSFFVTIEHPDYFIFQDTILVESDSSFHFLMQKMYPAVISGNVITDNGGTVNGTIVWCQGILDTLDSGGKYYLTGIRPGNIKIFAYLFGYKTSHLDTTVLNGDSISVDFMLTSGNDEIFDDFESNQLVEINAYGDWELGQPVSGPAMAYSGQHCWATNLDSNYSHGHLKNYMVTEELSILGLAYPVLQFAHWYDFEQDIDGGNVKISTDNGQTWTIINPTTGYPSVITDKDTFNVLKNQPAFSGQGTSWRVSAFDLIAFKSMPSVLIKFEVGSNRQNNASGWFIDDFKLFDGNATAIDTEESLEGRKLNLNIYPNPANPAVYIEFSLNRSLELSIDIFDISGANIKTLSNERFSQGFHRIKWNGINKYGYYVASGMYFIRIKNNSTFNIKKILLLR